MHLVLSLLGVVAVAYVFLGLFVVLAMRVAPRGREDENGFHVIHDWEDPLEFRGFKRGVELFILGIRVTQPEMEQPGLPTPAKEHAPHPTSTEPDAAA